MLTLSCHIEDWALKTPFRITGAEWTSFKSVIVELYDGTHIGRGEAQGVSYMGECVESMLAQINSVSQTICEGVTRQDLLALLPPGGARNAIDCALWDLECKTTGQSIWTLTDIWPKPLTTVFTIGLEASAQEMAAKAHAAAEHSVLKIKLDGSQPVEKLQAIRAARPDATLVVDANQGWDFKLLQDVLCKSLDLNISMIEQPLPRGADAALLGFKSPIPLAADESCLHSGELEQAAERYDMINIKLDKTGGLTEALYLAELARSKGCQLMVGNMAGTSLSMAPSFVVAQLCDFIDIDGPLLLQHDRPQGLRYKKGTVDVSTPSLWG